MKAAFTIIVPMYNVGREIYRCLSSLRAQTYPEFEVLQLDGGSTDDTVSICRETVARDSRFRQFYYRFCFRK
ncbi:MAG: glycosyltransferase family 2 protein [Victivallales bacterium]